MRIAVVITARPSYARIQTAITALLTRDVDVQIVACASALLERYGRVVDLMRADYPTVPITEVYSTYEGATLITSAKETGALATELASVLPRLAPDRVLVIADRHEVLAAAQAAAYLHLPLVHVQGGERSGSIDDKCRDAITQLADIHLVATERAKYRVYGLTGSFAVHQVGCPSVDLAHRALNDAPVQFEELGGAGAAVDLARPFVVILQHPDTRSAGCATAEMTLTLQAAFDVQTQIIVFWPGEDAGAEGMAKVIRTTTGIHTIRHLPAKRFLKLLTQASCLIGNSSVGIRECAYLGVPVVNIGDRQHGRERARNVLDTPHDLAAITTALRRQIAHGPYARARLYGSGDSGERIAEVLCRG